ncbi:Hypothetical predicted protein [Pelobates cultripes]|uniref:Uncharacterized protein n=1 Tax=Pelobates cultripes TaxID=61616 RepID=A0AAD1W0E0_PELCU|nr:Hypothetical predicted protein [Pelobates cultripes]
MAISPVKSPYPYTAHARTQSTAHAQCGVGKFHRTDPNGYQISLPEYCARADSHPWIKTDIICHGMLFAMKPQPSSHSPEKDEKLHPSERDSPTSATKSVGHRIQ